MNKERGLEWGVKEAAKTVFTATEIVGNVAEHLHNKLAPTREMLWYQLWSPLRARKIRHHYGRGFRKNASFA